MTQKYTPTKRRFEKKAHRPWNTLLPDTVEEAENSSLESNIPSIEKSSNIDPRAQEINTDLYRQAPLNQNSEQLFRCCL